MLLNLTPQSASGLARKVLKLLKNCLMRRVFQIAGYILRQTAPLISNIAIGGWCVKYQTRISAPCFRPVLCRISSKTRAVYAGPARRLGPIVTIFSMECWALAPRE